MREMTNHHHQQFPDHCKLEETRSSLTSSILNQVHIKTIQFKLTASQPDSFIMSCCAYCWLVRVSLFIELGCPRDLGKEWRGDLGTFMISRPT